MAVNVPIHHFVCEDQDGKKYLKSSISFYVASEVTEDIEEQKKIHVEKLIELMKTGSTVKGEENDSSTSL